MAVTGFGGVSLPFQPKTNFEATTSPSVNDDKTNGYSVGSVWIDTVANDVFWCLDASTGAAIWQYGDTDDTSPTVISDHIADATIHFTEASIDHTAIQNIGTNSHDQIDTHISVALVDADFPSDGIMTRTSSGTYTNRTITGTTNQVDVVDGDGVSGNPTLSLPQDIHTGASPTFDNLTITTEAVIGGIELPHRIVHNSATGLHDGGVLSINVDTTKFDISAGEGHIVNNFTDPEQATLTEVPWTAFTAEIVTGLATQDRTYIAIDINGNIVQQASPFTPDQFRDHIFIGLIDHPDRTNIDLVFPLGVLGYDTGAQLQDVILALGIVTTSGNVFSAASTNLTLARSAGVVFRQGANYDGTAAGRKNPNFVASPGDSPVGFKYRYQDGAGGWTEDASETTNIIPGSYDDGDGILGTVANNKWSIQRIYYIDDTEPTTRVLFGQFTYASEAIAESALAGEAVNIDPDLLANYSLRGWLIVKGNTTDLSDTSTAKFITADKFGLTVSGGGTTATTDLQTAYSNSVDPEILLTAAQGGLSVTDASTPIGVDLFEVQDFARTTDYFKVDTSGIAVDGTILATGNATIEGGTLTVGDAAQDGKLILEGTTSNNLEVYAVGSTWGVIDSQVDLIINIDSNNNQTTERFVVAQDGTGNLGSPMLMITEGPTDGSDSATRIFGTVTIDENLVVKSGLGASNYNFGPSTASAGASATGNFGLEFGNGSTSGIRFIDFQSSGVTSDYDSRIQTSGGTSTTGEGQFTIIAGNIDLEADTDVTGDITVTGEFLAADGTEAAPSITFTSDIDTGMYSSGVNGLGLSVGGTQAFNIRNDGGTGAAFKLGGSGTSDPDITLWMGRPDFTVGSNQPSHSLLVTHTATTPGDAGTHSRISGLDVRTPNITLGAGDTITAAATAYIEGAPTEGASNYALWVDDGESRFDGDVTVTGNSTTTLIGTIGTLRTNLGSAAGPSHSFTSDTDTGMYRSGTNTIGFAAGGSLISTIDSSGMGVTGNITVTGTLAGLTQAEIGELQNIDTTTIDATQWGYVGAMDQAVATTNNVEFNQVGIGTTPSNNTPFALAYSGGNTPIAWAVDGTATGGGRNFLFDCNFDSSSAIATVAVHSILINPGTHTLSDTQDTSSSYQMIMTGQTISNAGAGTTLTNAATLALSEPTDGYTGTITNGPYTLLILDGTSHFDGPITTTSTIDGRDVAADGTELDSFDDELQNLTAAEIQQLQNIDSTTIDATQWGYVGAMDQDVATTDSVEFADLTVDNALVDGVLTVSPTSSSLVQQMNMVGTLSPDANCRAMLIQTDIDHSAATASRNAYVLQMINSGYVARDGTANAVYLQSLAGFTITGGGASGSITNLATLHIGAAPNITGYTGTVTNGPYALWSDSGDNRFDGNVEFNSTSAVTVATDDKILIKDTSDSDNLQTVTAQSIADLFNESVPESISVANEATDTTCFPAFFTAATGNLGPKTNANFTYNSNTSALGITGELDVDNININGNTISATDTDGSLTLDANGSGPSEGRIRIPNHRLWSSNTGEITAGSGNLASIRTNGGIYASKSIWANTRFGCSPFRYSNGGSATLGSTDASLDLTLPGGNRTTMEVHVHARLLTNTARVLRVHFNSDTGTTTHTTEYAVRNGTTNATSRTVRGIGLWHNNTIEGDTYIVFRMAGKVAANGHTFQMQMADSMPLGTSSGDIYKGGSFIDSGSTNLSNMTFEIFNSTTSNTPVTTSDDMEIEVEVYISNLDEFPFN